jgi:hypothetical protein
MEKKRPIKKKTEASDFKDFSFFFSLYSKIPLIGYFFFLKFGDFFGSEFFYFFGGLKQVFNLLIGWASPILNKSNEFNLALRERGRRENISNTTLTPNHSYNIHSRVVR